MKVTINHETTNVPLEYQDELLLWLLRDGLGFTGTHYGCGVGKCGSCMVLVNGEPTRTCQTEVASVADADVVTIEGIGANGFGCMSKRATDAIHPVQQAFSEYPLQCMWCLPGHLITAVALLEKNTHPDDNEIREAIAENLCRCGGYNQITRAVLRAAELYRERTQKGDDDAGE